MVIMRRPKSKAYVAVACLLIGLFGAGLWVLYDYSRQVHLLTTDNVHQQGFASVSPTPTVLPELTYQTLFSPTDLSNLDQSKLLVIVATGDIIPARGTDAQIRRQGADYPFDGVGIKDILSQADLTIADLEAPLLNNCPVHNEGFTFCGQSAFAKAMARAGIDIVSLENNHIGNYGAPGITETISHLQASQIDYADRQRLAVKAINGIKFGLLSFNGITGWPILDQGAVAAITKAKSEVDVLMVAVHWGKEYQLVPTADPGIAPEDPLVIGRQLVDAGADLVIGNHPHWVQGVELYKNALIVYAHGNFIFDQSWSTETSQGVIGRYTYYGKRLIKVEYIPVQIANQAQPAVAEGQVADDILRRLHQSTELIKTKRDQEQIN